MSTRRISYSVAEAAAETGLSVDVIRRAIAAKALIPRYPTSRPVILADDLRDWIENSPTERPEKAS